MPLPASMVRLKPVCWSASISVLLPEPGPPVKTKKRSAVSPTLDPSPCRPRRPHCSQTLSRVVERVIAFAEGEPHLLGAIPRVTIETRPGYSGHPDLAHQVLGEGKIIGVSKGADVGHHVVGASRKEATEPRLLKRRDQTIPPPPVALRQLTVIVLRHAQGRGSRLLQRRRCPHRQKVVYLADRVRDRRRRYRPSHAPARDAVSLGHAVDGDGAVLHPIERRHANVLCAVVQNVFVNFLR